MLLRLLPVVHVLGGMLMFFSIAYLMPIAASFIYADGTWVEFVDAMGMALGIGALMWIMTRRHKRELKPRDGFLLVTLAWILMAAIAAVPLMLVIDGLSFTDAFFEAISGLTTTGATVLTGLEKLPPAVNIWRHELNWLGGMGIIVLAVAILPLLASAACALQGRGDGREQGCQADGAHRRHRQGPLARLFRHHRGLHPRAQGRRHGLARCRLPFFRRAVARRLFHLRCQRRPIRLAGDRGGADRLHGDQAINFASHFLVRERSLAVYLRDAEARAWSPCCILDLVCSDFWASTTRLLTNLRHVAFNQFNRHDCGFASQDYDKWPAFVPLWMLFLSCITVSSGSTGGGIKMVRTLILGRQALVELKRLIHPHVVAPVRVGEMVVSQQVAGAVLGFIFLYILTIGELTFFLIASGLDFTSSITAIIACINNAGPGLNVVGPAQNYQALSDFQVWVCSAAMLIGRLEVMTVFVLLTPAFWKK
jgi:trk system potassium uptake protein TrkH